MSSFNKRTELVDLHVKTLRKRIDNNGRTYNNIKEWLSYEENVYIGRRGRVFIGCGEDKVIFTYKGSLWENPFTVKNDGIDEVRNKYYFYILDKIRRENLYSEIRKLNGKNLGCWCCPNKCHGDVLIYLLTTPEINENF